MSFRLVPNSVTLDDLEWRNSRNGRVISPNSVAFGTDYDDDDDFLRDWEILKRSGLPQQDLFCFACMYGTTLCAHCTERSTGCSPIACSTRCTQLHYHAILLSLTVR